LQVVIFKFYITEKHLFVGERNNRDKI